MRRRLILSHVLVVAIVLLVLEIPLGILFARRQDADVIESATRQAALIATFVGPDFDQPVGRSLNAVLAGLGDTSPAEITIVDRTGKVIASRHGAVPDDRDLAPRATVESALTGQVATGTVDDDGVKWTYAAVPVTSRDSQVGAVLVSLPRHETDERIATTWLLLGGLAGGILALTALVAAGVTRWLSRPIVTLAAAVSLLSAERLSAGGVQSVAPTDSGPPELRALAAQFNDMAQRLHLLLDSQRRFLADASHQLRAPLTALRLRIENLEDAPTVDVEPALAEADRLGRLLDGLLALSRAEGARSEPERIDVTAIVLDRIDAWSALCAEGGVDLRLSHGADQVEAIALVAPGHLEQILDNLIANSLEVSSSGTDIDIGIDLDIGFPAGRSIDDGPMVSVAVIDHGPGMTEEQREHAFDRFWQSDSRPTGSSGLGLAIVQQLSAANRGRVTLVPTPGGGLTSRVSFPHPAR